LNFLGLIAPSLEMLQPIILETLDPSPVLNIEFSRQEGLMAVSYGISFLNLFTQNYCPR